MKKTLALLLILALMSTTLFGCGSSGSSGNAETSKQAEDAKGSRKNPYQIGDEISFTFYPILDNVTKGVDTLDAKLTVVDFLNAEKTNDAFVTTGHGTSEPGERLAEIKLSIEGDYDDPIGYGAFWLSAYTMSQDSGLIEHGANYLNKELTNAVRELYTDIDYDFYLWIGNGDDSTDEYKYLQLNYKPSKEAQQDVLWIAVTD